jgi:hypothetical protein
MAEHGLDPAMVKTLSRWLDDTPTDLDRALAVLWLAEDEDGFLAARQQVLALVEQRPSEAQQALDRIEAWCVAQDRYSKGESPTTQGVRKARRGEA